MVDLLLRDACKVPVFREVLANEAVGVPIQPSLPGGVRMGKKEPGIEAFRNGLMTGEFLVVIGDQRVNAVSDGLVQLGD